MPVGKTRCGSCWPRLRRRWSKASLESSICCRFLAAQLQTPQNASPRLRPRSVSRYSTFGGMTGCAVLTRRPSRSICRTVCVNIFWLIPPTSSAKRVKRSSPCSARTSMMIIVHLSATRPISSLTKTSMRGSLCSRQVPRSPEFMLTNIASLTFRCV